jgi:hypothetical protein
VRDVMKTSGIAGSVTNHFSFESHPAIKIFKTVTAPIDTISFLRSCLIVSYDILTDVQNDWGGGAVIQVVWLIATQL